MATVRGVRGLGRLASAPRLLISPKTAWMTIEGEVATRPGLFFGYVGVLAAIPAVCRLVGGQLFGEEGSAGHARPDLMASLGIAGAGYALALASTYLLAVVIDGLAPSFDAKKDRVAAFKVAAYSGTAGWVGGVFQLRPDLAPLSGLFALYGLYLVWTGLIGLMKPKAGRAGGYGVIVILFAVALYLAVAVFLNFASHRAALSQQDRPVKTDVVNIQGQQIDIDRLEAAVIAARSASAPAPRARAAGASAVPLDPQKLRALLPARLDGLAPIDVVLHAAGPGQGQASYAEAVFLGRDRRLSLRISDMTDHANLGGLTGALGLDSARRTATGYDVTRKVDGRAVHEAWDGVAKTGRFSTVIADRFVIEASGAVPGVQDLRTAVKAVDQARLEGLAGD